MQPVIAIDHSATIGSARPERPRGRIGAIREIAAHVEEELREVAEGWDRLADDERSELARALAQVAPGVLHLVCPTYGRFGAS